MTQQQLLLRLLDLDAQIARLQEQHQRNGLSAYQERRGRLSQELESKSATCLQLERDIEAGEASFDQDTLLNKMLELEELQPQLPGLRESLAEVEHELLEAGPEEGERRAALAVRLEAMARERAEITGQLPHEFTAAYQKNHRLDEIKQGRCRCRLEVPDHYQRQLRAGQAWVCHTCGSLLVQNLHPLA
jgi:predicted  nucleic acid-binding Zn-ribbon protein